MRVVPRERNRSLDLCLVLGALWLAAATWPPPACQGTGAPPTGLALLAQGHYQEAMAALDAEVQARPDDPGLGIARCKCLVELGRWQAALEASLALERRFPDREDAALLAGDCYFILFRPGDAAVEYRRVHPSQRWGPTALSKLMGALLAQGREAEALAAESEWAGAGREVPDEALGLAVQASEDAPGKLAALEALAARRPEEPTLRDSVALYGALKTRPPSANRPPASFPSRVEVKEIGREPCIRVVVDGSKGHWLVFDTGSESPLLKEDTARKLNLPELASATYEGWGFAGAQKTRYVFVTTMEVAGRILVNFPAIIDTRNPEFWSNKAGYIGLRPFRQNVVLYDRRHGLFELEAAQTSASSLLKGSYVTLPVLYARGLPLVPVMIQGRGPYPFLLDTGATYTLLSSDYAPRLGIHVNSGKFATFHGMGVSGAFSSGIAERVALDIAGQHFDRRESLVTEIPHRFPVPVYGILGRDLLNEFIMVFDGPSAQVTLQAYDLGPAKEPETSGK